jgi:hypothetical protein
VQELISIIDSRALRTTDTGTVDKDYFPNIEPLIYKAREINHDGNGWYVHFGNYGTASASAPAATPASSIHELYVAELPGNRFSATKNLTVTANNSEYVIVDGDLDLIWLFEKDPQAKNWEQALSYTSVLNSNRTGGYSDWRLPNKNELDSLVVRTKPSSPKVPEEMLEDVNSSVYESAFWTNTKWLGTESTLILRVDFRMGDITILGEDEYGRAVYVRNRVTTP